MHVKRLLLLSLILSAGCKPPTAAEQMDSVLSWIGTAGMAGDAWLRHTTRDAYTRQTLELSRDNIGQISKDLLASPPPRVDSAALAHVLTGAQGRIARMAGLITARNAPAFTSELDSLRADQKLVKKLSDSIHSRR
jgi:hypothetical protein